MSNPVAIKLKTYIGYGMTDLFSSGAFAIIAAWLMYFFTNFSGLTRFRRVRFYLLRR